MHAAGCRRWFHVVRDTNSHAILQTYRVGEWPDPAILGGEGKS